MAWTRQDGWVWVFVTVDHYSAEAWTYVSKISDRIAALDPVYQAVIDRRLDADIARKIGIAVASWTHTYNTEWLIQRHGHLTPREAFQLAATPMAA